MTEPVMEKDDSHNAEAKTMDEDDQEEITLPMLELSLDSIVHDEDREDIDEDESKEGGDMDGDEVDEDNEFQEEENKFPIMSIVDPITNIEVFYRNRSKKVDTTKNPKEVSDGKKGKTEETNYEGPFVVVVWEVATTEKTNQLSYKAMLEVTGGDPPCPYDADSVRRGLHDIFDLNLGFKTINSQSAQCVPVFELRERLGLTIEDSLDVALRSRIDKLISFGLSGSISEAFTDAATWLSAIKVVDDNNRNADDWPLYPRANSSPFVMFIANRIRAFHRSPQTECFSPTDRPGDDSKRRALRIKWNARKDIKNATKEINQAENEIKNSHERIDRSINKIIRLRKKIDELTEKVRMKKDKVDQKIHKAQTNSNKKKTDTQTETEKQIEKLRNDMNDFEGEALKEIEAYNARIRQEEDKINDANEKIKQSIEKIRRAKEKIEEANTKV